LESADPRAALLAESPLIDLPGREHLDKCGPAELLSARVAAAAELREIPLRDDGRRVSLLPLRKYRRHLAALRILEITDPLELPWDRHDVRALFSIALNPKGASAEQAQHQFDIPTGFPHYAAQQIISRLVAPVRLDLHAVAIGAVEQLRADLGQDGRKIAARARDQIRLHPGHAYQRDELLARISDVLAPRGR
jgi:hypothetical protein